MSEITIHFLSVLYDPELLQGRWVRKMSKERYMMQVLASDCTLYPELDRARSVFVDKSTQTSWVIA